MVTIAADPLSLLSVIIPAAAASHDVPRLQRALRLAQRGMVRARDRREPWRPWHAAIRAAGCYAYAVRARETGADEAAALSETQARAALAEIG